MANKLGHFDAVTKAQRISATITVYDTGTANLSTIYSDLAGTVPLANPFSTDDYGRFQFFADGGEYDIRVSGAGITTYWIRGVTLAVQGPQGPIDGITPEDYGAQGDGVTDDWAAFNNMFIDLASSGAPTRKKIILNPEVYYSIQSRKNATNVFEIDVDDIIMIGPGMGVPCLVYEGANTATNFLYFYNQPGYNEIHDLQIKCGAGDDANTRDLSKITNIICWDDTKYTSLSRCEFTGCTGKCVTGYNWMSEARHCIFKWFGIAGLDEISTTAHVIGCYANGGSILAGSRGFIVETAYGFYGGNACDHCDVGYYLDMPGGGVVTGQGNGAEGCRQYMLSTGGVIYWDGIAGNNTGLTGLPSAWVELVNNSGRLAGFSNTYDNTYLLKTTNCPDLMIDNNIPKAAVHVTDSTPTKYQDPIRLGHDYIGDEFRNVAVADFEDLVETTLHNYQGVQNASAIIPDGAATVNATLVLRNLGGWGKFIFYRQNAWGTTTFTFNQGAGNGFEIYNANLPLEFYGHNDPVKIHFQFVQSGTGVLFKLTNCQLVRFYGVELDAESGSGDAFELDDFSTLELDKTTMDRMSTLFSGLCNKPERVRFTGYTDKPAAGRFDAGCRIFFDDGSSGYIGCICTVGGAPGTWKYFGATV